MKYALVAMMLFIPLGCSGPDKFEEVRKLRRKYQLDVELIVSLERKAVKYEIDVKNLSGSDRLQEVTVMVECLDKDEKVFWSRQHELDITGLGDYETKSFQFQEVFEEPERVALYQIRLAPDDEGSDYKNYKEFLRVAL